MKSAGVAMKSTLDIMTNLGWIVSWPDGSGWVVVSARTRGRAKTYHPTYDCFDPQTFLDLRAKRFSQADGYPEGELYQWRECGICNRITDYLPGSDPDWGRICAECLERDMDVASGGEPVAPWEES